MFVDASALIAIITEEPEGRALAGMDDRALARQTASAIGAIVHIERGRDGARRVTGIARPVVRGDRLGVEELA